MAPRCFFIFFIVLGVCRSLPEGSEYPSTSEFSKKQLTEDRLLANIVRARNSSKSSQAKDNENDSEDRNADKRARTLIRGPPSSESRGSNCCGTRQGSGSLSRPDYDKILTEGGRYPPSYGDRNVDRHGWQVPTRPTGSNIGGGRPTSGSYGGSYGGSGVYGGTYAGDRFGSRPGYGGESPNRPGGPSYGSGGTGGYGYGNGGYGGYGGTRPGIGYGITGTLEDGDDFNPNEPDIPENGVHPHYPGNIQTQKAVALKALAGVALIGAAAALATNPVLLPIGIVSGRRKRSEITSENNEIMDYVLQMITKNLSRTNNDRSYNDKKIVPPKCVARLTCEIRKDYMADLTENTGERYDDKYAQIQFNNLIQSNVLNTASIDDSIKELIKMALAVSSDKGDCGVFACNFTHDN